jgi:hypothetical protein
MTVGLIVHGDGGHRQAFDRSHVAPVPGYGHQRRRSGVGDVIDLRDAPTERVTSAYSAIWLCTCSLYDPSLSLPKLIISAWIEP